MKQVEIRLPQRQIEALERIARENRLAPADLVGQAVDGLIAEAARLNGKLPGLREAVKALTPDAR